MSIPNISVSQVVNKVQSLKADYKAFCTLKKQTGVGWNYETNTVEADDVWWDNFTRGLANFPELDLLFAESTAAGLNAYSSGQGGETEEEAARVEVKTVIGTAVGRVTEEHIASGGLRTDSNGPAPMNTQSGARKRGSTSIGRRGKEKACIEALEKIDPPLTAEQYVIVFRELSGHMDNQTGFLSMPPVRRNCWAWSLK
ncbi:hypothetical protein CJ030_MR0G013381 [Morella rubra]|uniref:Myb/SANT-like domain-containing protein n=1 Tax=Morella rubra TaxID=262757 RepID=A0A6A1UGV4_9ROSI|nr:hypothetical protein CJ030_MR0G013381 [Morella rubra]